MVAGAFRRMIVWARTMNSDSRRCFLKQAGGAALAPAVLRAAAAPPRPNIVVFLSDDHGYFDSSVAGSKVARTPAMQRLAQAGMVFTRAFTGSPTCVPSRAIISTGLMPARNGAERNHTGVRVGITTLPTYLKAAGYHAAHFGKSHFQPRAQFSDWEWVPSQITRGPLTSDLDPAAFRRWLENSRPKDRPLCLFVCSHSPHVYWEENTTYDPAKVELPPTFIDTPETRAARTKYYTDITKADEQLGYVYQAANEHLGRNTLFIYTSDNGAQWPFAKWSLYDAGIHLPFIAVWPGAIKAGSETAAMISFCDLLPTFAELAGAGMPPDLDGQSFASVLTAGNRRHRSEIFAAHSGDGDMNVFPTRCVRTERFKYILNLRPEFEYTTHIDRAGGPDDKSYWDSWVAKAKTDPRAAAIVKRYHQHPREELYDVIADPHETNNLATDSRHQKTRDQMGDRLQAWMKQQGDAGKVYGEPRLLRPA